jgi:hypothetical protein
MIIAFAGADMAAASLLDDAKNLLNRLNSIGSVPRQPIENEVSQARDRFAQQLRFSAEQAARKINEGRNRFADLKLPSQSEAGEANRRAADTYRRASKDGIITKYEQQELEKAGRESAIASKQAEYDMARQKVGRFEQEFARSGKLTPAERDQLNQQKDNVARLGTELAHMKSRDRDGDIKESVAKDAAIREAEAALEQAIAALAQFNQDSSRREHELQKHALAVVNDKVSFLNTKLSNAKRSLQDLVPPPAGSRATTRTEQRCSSVGGIQKCVNVSVPNPPAGDGELRRAVDSANTVLTDIFRGGQDAAAQFNLRLHAMQQEMVKLDMVVSNLEKKLDRVRQK